MARRDDKDTAMDGLLRRSFAADAREDAGGGISGGAPAGATKECPSAETLAAYYERTLDDAERARYELHFSTCGRCREQLAALVRADESVSGAGARHASGWSWFTNQWWLAPVAGTLAIVAVVYFGAATRRHASPPQVAMRKVEPPTDTNVAPPPVPKAAPAAAPLASDVERLKRQTGEAAGDKAEAKKKAPAAASAKAGEQPRVQSANGSVESAEAKPAVAQSQSAGAARATTTARASTATRTAGAGRAVQGGFAGGRAQFTPPVSSAAKAAAPVAPRRAAPAQIPPQTEAVDVTAAAPAVNAQGPAPPPAPTEVQETYSDADKQNATSAQELSRSRTAAGGVDQPTSRVLARTEKEADEVAPAKPNAASKSKTGAPALKAQPAAALTVARPETKIISSPDSQSQWRIAEGGFVEHSENGGNTWTGTEPAPDAQWTAGSSPAARTCWFVGRNGLIVVTTDAMHWKIVAPPVQADFADVTATSGRDATVTTADGRKFSTRNAGKSWQAVP